MEKLISHVLLKDQLFFESHRENAFGLFFFFLNQIVSACCQKCELSQLQGRKLPVPFTEYLLTWATGQQSIKMAKRPRSISMENCFISVWASCSDNGLPKLSLALWYHSHRKITSKQKVEQTTVMDNGVSVAAGLLLAEDSACRIQRGCYVGRYVSQHYPGRLMKHLCCKHTESIRSLLFLIAFKLM